MPDAYVIVVTRLSFRRCWFSYKANYGSSHYAILLNVPEHDDFSVANDIVLVRLALNDCVSIRQLHIRSNCRTTQCHSNANKPFPDSQIHDQLPPERKSPSHCAVMS